MLTLKPLSREEDPRFATGFDYEEVYDFCDGPEALDPDEEFWRLSGELFGDLLSWLTDARGLTGMGARVAVLALYLNPGLIDESSLSDISKLGPDAPTRAALSKALVRLQEKYGLKRGRFQKESWQSEQYRRSALASHANRRQLKAPEQHPL